MVNQLPQQIEPPQSPGPLVKLEQGKRWSDRKLFLERIALFLPDREDPEWVAFATSAFQASAGVMHGSPEQRATQNVDGTGELGY